MCVTMIIKKSWAWDGGMWEELNGVIGSIETMQLQYLHMKLSEKLKI